MEEEKVTMPSVQQVVKAEIGKALTQFEVRFEARLMAGIDTKFEHFEAKFDEKLARLEARLEAKFDEKLEKLEARIDAKFDEKLEDFAVMLQQSLLSMQGEFSRRFDDLEERIIRLERTVLELKYDLMEIKTVMRTVLHKDQLAALEHRVSQLEEEVGI